jgi:4-hydroxybenzoate polyprenyltransferase
MKLQIIKNYIFLFRFDHSIKQIFVIPGILVALAIGLKTSFFNIIIGFVSIQLAASSNYIINEWLDKDTDKYNPRKKLRPSVVREVSKRYVYFFYFFTSASSIFLSFLIGKNFLNIIIFFLIMGIVYNVKPFRAKDISYLDFIIESVNNPIRLLLGFNMFNSGFWLPSSIIIFYWSAGAFLMACKRYAEYNSLDKNILVKYRKSFKNYNINNLLLSIFFTSMLSISMITVFMIKYKIEFIFFIISIAILFLYYLHITLKPNSEVQNINHLYKDKLLIIIIFFCIIVFITSLILEFNVIKVLEKRLEFNLKYY